MRPVLCGTSVGRADWWVRRCTSPVVGLMLVALVAGTATARDDEAALAELTGKVAALAADHDAAPAAEQAPIAAQLEATIGARVDLMAAMVDDDPGAVLRHRLPATSATTSRQEWPMKWRRTPTSKATWKSSSRTTTPRAACTTSSLSRRQTRQAGFRRRSAGVTAVRRARPGAWGQGRADHGPDLER